MSLESVEPFSSYLASKSGQGIIKEKSPSEIFVNIRVVSLKMTSHLTSDNFQILIIDTFSKPRKI